MLTLGQAAKETGLSKPTISAAIKKGRLSASRGEGGQYQIDPAELFRVYPPSSNENVMALQSLTPQETGTLHREIELLREQLEREREFNAELSRRLDEEAQERRKSAEEIRRLTLLLTHKPERETTQPEPTTPKVEGEKGRFWEKLFGRSQID
ncbi:DNA binding domain-containing protein, excisionase family [Methylomagnum ishizawai]|uniref:DNA binding domain-containing protein, excisionase family n=1 Tax=Methylomagnum ishizawai TaxID=1760988 RepID=A0A1Y6DET4_9GAMM|nr:helix-turn-helix domain-containing protein [Methylomagnum ishizawai]SMF97925.1 DNA binding domain-containing protein, excisionase family [Methylomagnum ishizawai]SMF97937.1 DNA binding domain-containing protein, excisionase family [Methylomagnum ishizawai]